MALKPSQLAFEKSLLEERLRYVKRLKEDLEQEGGTTAQTVAAYTSIIDGAAGGGCRVLAVLERQHGGGCVCPFHAPPSHHLLAAQLLPAAAHALLLLRTLPLQR